MLLGFLLNLVVHIVFMVIVIRQGGMDLSRREMEFAGQRLGGFTLWNESKAFHVRFGAWVRPRLGPSSPAPPCFRQALARSHINFASAILNSAA
jgi:hypothetical protein